MVLYGIIWCSIYYDICLSIVYISYYELKWQIDFVGVELIVMLHLKDVYKLRDGKNNIDVVINELRLFRVKFMIIIMGVVCVEWYIYMVWGIYIYINMGVIFTSWADIYIYEKGNTLLLVWAWWI